MNNTQESITDFYDKFVEKQDKLGVSVRHQLIYKKLKSLDIQPHSNVLEIGCGIGTASSLIIKNLKGGKFDNQTARQ